MKIEYIYGQTPIAEEEKDGLLISTISTKQELDEFEQLNIEEALQWLYPKKFKPNQVFSEKFICNLHKRMFGKVWDWAGSFRKTNKNIGVDRFQIPTQLKMLLEDALFWLENGIYTPEELALRFKHRLVSIHCFPNGNGRHSRLMADVVMEKLFAQAPFTWGAGDLCQPNDVRKLYISAVRAADRNDYQPLLTFARS